MKELVNDILKTLKLYSIVLIIPFFLMLYVVLHNVLHYPNPIITFNEGFQKIWHNFFFGDNVLGIPIWFLHIGIFGFLYIIVVVNNTEK